MSEKKNVAKYIMGTIFLFISIVMIVAIIWVKIQFPNLDFNSIVFHLNVPLKGSNNDTFTGVIITSLVLASFVSVLVLLVLLKVLKKEQITIRLFKKKKILWMGKVRKVYPVATMILLLIVSIVGLKIMGIDTYIRNHFVKTKLFEEKYVDTKKVKLEFPQKKRNLIYIMMESMEDDYSSQKYGGKVSKDYMPEMTKLQLNNINFTSKKDKLNQGYSAYGATWTVGGIVAQTSGLPLNIPIGMNQMKHFGSFLNGAQTLGDILQKEGYNQTFLLGSRGSFGGQDIYFKQHGDYKIKDYPYALKEGWIPKNYHVFWGYEDKKLYENAKKELDSLYKEGKPFNLLMSTIDTHFVGGYVCDLCKKEFGDDQYANVIACASRQVNAFVEWLKKQPYYKDTTIIIDGDHPTMDSAYIQDVLKDDTDGMKRRVYTAVINSACDYTIDKDRLYTTMDMFPTTLASMGIKIPGQRLGLGTNLFSKKKTLAEEMGLEKLNEELGKKSDFYEKKIIYNSK